MKVLKWIVIILIALIAIFLIYSASQPNKAVLEKSIEVEAPIAKVYESLIHFPSWSNWSAWAKKDPNMENEYSEEFGIVGSYSSWKSDNPEVGNGRQEVIEVRENEYFKMAMNFTDWPGTKHAEFILSEAEGTTKVTWTYEGSETPFYLNFMNPLIEGMLEVDYKSSLQSFKEYMESQDLSMEVENPMNLEIIEAESQAIVSILDSTNAEGISAKLGELYTELSIFLEMNENISSAGMPLAIYHYYSKDRVIMEAAIPYSGTAESQGRIVLKETPKGKVLKGIHYGSYDASEAMHIAIEEYGNASKLEFNGPCWEVYANDPTTVDSAAVETHIYYPIN